MAPTPTTLKFDRLEADLAQAARTLNAATPADPPPEHFASIEQHCEYAARKLEEMFAESKARTKDLTDALAECEHDMRLIAESALAIREKGKHAAALIQEVKDFSMALRAACTEIVEKLK